MEEDVQRPYEVPDEERCAAVLEGGSRCENAARPGSDYCELPEHAALEDTAGDEVAAREPSGARVDPDAEAEAAATEAAHIGGVPSADQPDQGVADEAARPVVEGGGGESEGFEQAEEQLVQHAEHAPEPEVAPDAEAPAEDTEDRPPARDPRQEAEAERARREARTYGDADQVESTEVVRDPDQPDPEEDPGAGPGIPAER